MSILSEKRRFSFWILGIFFVFIVGGLGGVVMNKYLIPGLSSNSFFGKIGFFKESSERVTIINKTEQVTVKEDDSVNQIASRAATAVVNIISVEEKGKFVSAKVNAKSGTGILATSDGMVITYRDVIFEKNSTYAVLLYNNDKYDAKLLAIDEFTNLAYLKIDATNLPSIDFANSDDFKPGKKLVSIGNSLSEYQNRFSAGLLSNINKTFNLSGEIVSSSEKLEGVFETDFDNQQNYLGGPLISYNGDLVGIIGKTSIDNKDFFFQIPANAVKDSLNRVLDGKIEQRAYFGVYYIPITKEYAISNNISKDKGALVYSLSAKQSMAFMDGSPAQKSGLKAGDIISAIDGKDIDLSNPLSNIISKYNKGDKIELSVFRENKEIKILVQL